MDSQRSWEGRTLGRYLLGAKIGAGGMGEVYRARDTRLDRDVAVKLLPEHLAGDPEALRRFEREAKAVAALSHSNILAIHDFGDEQGVSYAVMELLEGETLRARMSRSAPGWREAVDIGAAIAEGLAAAHANGIIHRDLKPENVFLTQDGVVKILDFGLAHMKQIAAVDSETFAASERTTPGTVMGTIGYMSPEQVRGEAVEAPGDLFALGCVLHEMTGGQRPFERGNAMETMAAILREDPPALAELNKEAPVELGRVIAHCLEKKPERRFQSGRDLAFALKAVSSGSGIPLPAVPQAMRRLRLSPASWAAVSVVLLAIAAWLYVARGRPRIDSLAVMPFAIVGRDEQTEILSDGINESVINSLSQLPQLKRVIARSTVSRYKGKAIDPRKVGRELNVQAVLIGTLLRKGENLVIEMELVNTADESRLWGGQYPLKLAEVFEVQTEIARKISEKLSLRLSGQEQKQLARHPTENTEAYQLYLQGRYHWSKDTKPELQKAIELYQQAIALDPSYALAWAGIADAYGLLAGDYLPADEAMPMARAAAQKALELDGSLAGALAILAASKVSENLDFKGGERDLQRAIELNPGYAPAHNQYGTLLVYLGRFDEAQVEMDRARELDPLSAVIQVGTVWPVLFARHYDQAIEQLRKIIALEPSSNAYINLAWAYTWKGEAAKAFGPLDQAQSTDDFWAVVAGRGCAYAQTGQRDKARQALAELQLRVNREHVSGYGLAILHAALGEKDQAFAALDKAVQERDGMLLLASVVPSLDSLRSDPRFTALLRKLNLAR